MEKNILIISSSSELASRTIEELKNKNWNIFATSRHTNVMDENVKEYYLDVTNEMDFIHLKEKFQNIKFNTIINFAGIAVAGAVEELNEQNIKTQFEVNLYGLLKIIKYFAPNLEKNGKLINISSMAGYGIFPFLSPYCMSKASADILLNAFSIETNTKVVSIRPGVVATKFWESSIELNKKFLDNNNEKYKNEKVFLLKNAQNNSLKALNPITAAKQIARIIELKNPKPVYNIGIDSKFVKFTRFLPLGFTNFLIKTVLEKRLKKK